MKFGITGGGYVGSMLIERLLKNDHEVVCIDNFHKGNCDHLFSFTRDPNFSFINGDINHLEDIQNFYSFGPDIIINTAAIVGFPSCKKHQVVAQATNSNSLSMLLKCRNIQLGDIPFITCSTDSIYGVNDKQCTENTSPNPQSLYGKTKVEAEELVKAEKNTVILRFSTGMGVSYVMRNNLLVNDLVYTSLLNGKIEIFEADVSRSFINVQDMGYALSYFGKKLYDHQLKHVVYNIGCDSLNYTKRQLAESIKRKVGCEVVYNDFDKDIDCRDYSISHKRQYDAGFKPRITMDSTIDSLIRTHSLIHWQKKYQ